MKANLSFLQQQLLKVTVEPELEALQPRDSHLLGYYNSRLGAFFRKKHYAERAA